MHSFISFFVYKDTKIKDLYKIILDSAQTSSMIFFIIANAMLFAHFLTDEQIPQQITQMIIEANLGPLMFLLIVNILFTFNGTIYGAKFGGYDYSSFIITNWYCFRN